MSQPEDQRTEAGPTVEEDEVLYCYGHPDRPTQLRCTRCNRPICGQCAIPASVGQHCPECVAEARRSAPKVKSAMRAYAPAVVTIVGINVAVFVLQFFIGPTLGISLTERLALHRPSVALGEWWRLLTPMVLHAGLLHLGLNGFVLWVYGPYVERSLGSLRFVIAYVTAGLAASATSYALGGCRGISVGASGAIFGIVGVLLVYLYRRRTSAFIGRFLQGVLVFVGINLFIGFTIPNIDNWAHIGGLVGGVLLGAGYDTGEERTARTATWIITTAVVIAISVALVVLRTELASCAPPILPI